ncbi:MAG: hypothetical protein OSA95_01835 [Opitutales bacterium]|nr:hypothetical protein [Opitutales bacterium]
MKKSVLVLYVLLSGCIHNPDPYHQNIRELRANLESGNIGTADYIRQRILLDDDQAASVSKRHHAALLRFPAMESTHDPQRHGTHYKLIETAKANGELTDAQYNELRQLANETREARNKRSQKRTMDRFRMGYR